MVLLAVSTSTAHHGKPIGLLVGLALALGAVAVQIAPFQHPAVRRAIATALYLVAAILLIVALVTNRTFAGVLIAIAVVVAGVALWKVWRERAPRGTPRDGDASSTETRPPQESFQSEGATDELDVSIEDEEWHRFQQKALILEAKVRVHSNAANAKTIRRQASAQIYEDGQPVPSFEFMTDAAVKQEVIRLEQRRNAWPQIIERGATVYAWYVLSMPHRLQGGEPEYVITILDEHGHEYSVRRQARPK